MTRRTNVERRSVRRRAVGVGVLAASLILSGCALAADPDWTPPQWPAASVAEVTAPVPLAAAELPSLRGQRIRNDVIGFQSRIAFLPGQTAWGDAMLALVHQGIDHEAARTGASYAPQVFPRGSGLGDRACMQGSTLRPATEIVADPALGPTGGIGTAITCDIVAATGPYLGQRVRVVSADGAGITGDSSTLLYVDTASGETAFPAALWIPEAAATLWSDIVDVVRRSQGSLSLGDVAPPDEAGLAAMNAALAQTLVAPDGSLVLTLAPGFIAPELVALGVPATTEPLTIGIPPAASAAITTPFGSGLVTAAAAATPYAPPADVPAGLEPVDCGLVPCIAMTYDDGPSDLTPGILDAAAARHASITFFAMGGKAAQYADTMKRAIAEGHLVENHTWDHPHLPDIPAPKAIAEIRDTTAAIAAATGVAPTVFRPPYGDYTKETLQQAGMAAILWDVDTLDWQGPADDVLISRAVDEPRPGSIVLQHDIQPNTGRTVGAVYDGLADRGFVLVNIRQLFGGHLPGSGAWRSGR